jgi:hypothetical protein
MFGGDGLQLLSFNSAYGFTLIGVRAGTWFRLYHWDIARFGHCGEASRTRIVDS